MNDLDSHGIVVLIRNISGEYLFLEEAREQMRGHWAPPHGRCEAKDKTEETSVIRETFEETGITVRPVAKLHTQPADTKIRDVSFWLAEAKNIVVTLDEESSAFAWKTISDALKDLLLYPGTRSFLEKVSNGEIVIPE